MTTYRLAAPVDLSAVAAVHIESCLDIYAPIAPEAVESGLLERNLRAIWAEERLANGDFIVMAEREGEAVALCTVRPAKYDAPYIDHFHVRPHLKGEGIGRGLMRAVFDEMRRRELASCWLDVAAGNDAAMAFYEAMGGVRGESVTGDLFGTPVEAIVIRWPALPAL
ncbi:MAG: GNAT family N-acetyltransferase [Pseudomonadota bacterium]